MAGSFPADTRFLAYCSQKKGRRMGVSIPAWAHRVTAPLIPRRGLDLFQRVILGLSQAGVRRPDRISALTQLHPRLCAYIIDQSKHAGLLDRHGEITQHGAEALRTGTVDEDTEWSVRYVFSDPRTGRLWPRTAERLTDAYVLHRARDHVVIELGTAGVPDRVRALRMNADPRRPAPPAADQVLEVVRRDRQAGLNARAQEFARVHNLAPLADLEEEQATYGTRLAADEELPELSRVTSIGDPEPVEIVGLIQAASADGTGQGWIAHDPFGVGTNAMFSEMIILWSAEGGAFASQLDELMAEQGSRIRSSHGKSMERARAQAETELIKEFGPGVRRDPGVLGKLKDLQLAAYEPGREKSVGVAMAASFALFEELFFRLAVAYPMPQDQAGPLADRAAQRRHRSRGRTGPPLYWPRGIAADTIRKAAEEIGESEVPIALTGASSDDIGRFVGDARSRKGASFRTVLAVCLLSAARRGDHPLRATVADRPSLLADLNTLRQIRNGQQHRLGSGSVADDLQWCRDLAALATRQLLTLPPATDRI